MAQFYSDVLPASFGRAAIVRKAGWLARSSERPIRRNFHQLALIVYVFIYPPRFGPGELRRFRYRELPQSRGWRLRRLQIADMLLDPFIPKNIPNQMVSGLITGIPRRMNAPVIEVVHVPGTKVKLLSIQHGFGTIVTDNREVKAEPYPLSMDHVLFVGGQTRLGHQAVQAEINCP